MIYLIFFFKSKKLYSFSKIYSIILPDLIKIILWTQCRYYFYYEFKYEFLCYICKHNFYDIIRLNAKV